MKNSVIGTYFYKQDRFTEGERASLEYSVKELGMHLDIAIEKELCVKSEWGLEELAILLNKPLLTLVNDGTIKNVLVQNSASYVRNKYKTIPSTELAYEKKKSVDFMKTVLRDKIRVNLLEPTRRRKELEREKFNATSEIQSRSILNQMNAIDSEITAYNEVLMMLSE